MPQALAATHALLVLGSRKEGHVGQLRTLGADGKLATQLTLDQDPTSCVWEEPREEGKETPTKCLDVPSQ